MLVANLGTEPRVAYLTEERRDDYTCPGCGARVNLRLPKAIVPHFAHHHDPQGCSYGETVEHMTAKMLLAQNYRRRGFEVKEEAVMGFLPGTDRRADILIAKSGRRWALEVQRSSQTWEEIDSRTRAYLDNGVPCIWIFILPRATRNFLKDGYSLTGLSPRQFISGSYVHNFVYLRLSLWQRYAFASSPDNTILFYAHEDQTFWLVKLHDRPVKKRGLWPTSVIGPVNPGWIEPGDIRGQGYFYHRRSADYVDFLRGDFVKHEFA